MNINHRGSYTIINNNNNNQSKATLRTDVGKRELARRTRTLRLEWEAAVKAANRIARGKRPPRRERGNAGQAASDASTALVELPFLRLLWGVHGSTTGGAAGAAAGGGSVAAEIEPSELKYLGASLRQTLVGRVTRKVVGGEVRSARAAFSAWESA